MAVKLQVRTDLKYQQSEYSQELARWRQQHQLKKKPPLSRKFSRAIRQVVEDLAELHQLGVVFDGGIWVQGVANQACAVCLGGCVMLTGRAVPRLQAFQSTLLDSPLVELMPHGSSDQSPAQRLRVVQLSALDTLRQGYFESAVAYYWYGQHGVRQVASHVLDRKFQWLREPTQLRRFGLRVRTEDLQIPRFQKNDVASRKRLLRAAEALEAVGL